MGCICDSKPNAVLTMLKHVCAWRSTVWWQNTKAGNMTVDPNSHTRWSTVGQDCFGLGWGRRVEQHKMKEGLCDPRNDEGEARGLGCCGRQIHQFSFAQKVLRCNSVEIAKWKKNGSMATTRWDEQFRAKLDEFRRHCTHDRNEKIAYPVAQIDDYVKHRQGAPSGGRPSDEPEKGRAKKSHNRKSKEHRGLESSTWLLGWEKNDNGWSGCGVAIKAFDREIGSLLAKLQYR